MENNLRVDFAVKEFMMPMAKLIGVYEVSMGYNYLPGETEDPDELAPHYYYGELSKIKGSIKSCKYLTSEIKKRMLKLWEDVRNLVSSCEGVDSLPKHWFDANPRLKRLTAITHLVYGVPIDPDEDKTAVDEMLAAFVTLMLSIFDSEWERAELLKLADNVVSNAAFIPLSDKERKSIRAKALKEKNDRKAVEKEAKIRTGLLKGMFGKIEKTDLSKRGRRVLNKIERDNFMKVYHSFEDDEKIIMLCISDEKLYWKNQRPYRGPIGTYAFGYIEHKKPCEENSYNIEDGFGQIWLGA